MKKNRTSALFMGLSVATLGTGGYFVHETKAFKFPEAPKEVQAVQSTTVTKPSKNAYFGELHLHTFLSFDAYTGGTRITPNDAYRFAKGESVNWNGKPIKRNVPLDFMAVTDHSEYMGVFNTIEDSNSTLSRSEVAKLYKSINQQNRIEFFKDILQRGKYQEVLLQKEVLKSNWQVQQEAANKNYEPGKFTTFIGYEWTSMPNNSNQHRNVIFRGKEVPERPFSSLDSPKPEDLWNFMDNYRKSGSDVLAIPHNQNVSDGLMYDWNDSDGNPVTKAHAIQRASNEILGEISQLKGVSETHPSLSPNDEFAGHEIMPFLLTQPKEGRIEGSYVRQAYGRGLVLAEKIGANPYKFGVIGSSDLHNGISTSRESDYNNPEFGFNADPSKAIAYKEGPGTQSLLYGSGSLAGVWAEENTRESIFDGLKRKETFATSGNLIKVRFFGGWNFPAAAFQQADWSKIGYEKGVPMGSDLPSKTTGAKAPSFLVWALKDPNAAHLDRIQVVKIWTKNGQPQEKVFNVAASDGRKPDKIGKLPVVGNTVDLKTGAYHNTIGDSELKTVWTDPEFDPKIATVYYVRVLEIPTPRWSTLLALKAAAPIPTQVPSIIQERAWSSPIWYTPSK